MFARDRDFVLNDNPIILFYYFLRCSNWNPGLVVTPALQTRTTQWLPIPQRRRTGVTVYPLGQSPFLETQASLTPILNGQLEI